MKPEINAAVGFLSRFLRVKGHVNDRQVQTFSQSLQDILAEQYKHHWFQTGPAKFRLHASASTTRWTHWCGRQASVLA
ncbi:protein BTG1 [Lates japonicus]|uniref:Protein BTG1 n=1 Tax=Lates japonicus TaxID=270547 RepID=A0AAD3M7J2_LATJO|nr:protein BTG1 [Lates japonicus]